MFFIPALITCGNINLYYSQLFPFLVSLLKSLFSYMWCYVIVTLLILLPGTNKYQETQLGNIKSSFTSPFRVSCAIRSFSHFHNLPVRRLKYLSNHILFLFPIPNVTALIWADITSYLYDCDHFLTSYSTIISLKLCCQSSLSKVLVWCLVILFYAQKPFLWLEN